MLLKGMEFDTAHFITDVSGKYSRLWALKGAHPVTVNRWYKFGVLASICTIAPGFREISELPDWLQLTLQPQLLLTSTQLTTTSADLQWTHLQLIYNSPPHCISAVLKSAEAKASQSQLKLDLVEAEVGEQPLLLTKSPRRLNCIRGRDHSEDEETSIRGESDGRVYRLSSTSRGSLSPTLWSCCCLAEEKKSLTRGGRVGSSPVTIGSKRGGEITSRVGWVQRGLSVGHLDD
ncbi:hypothetical protein ACS0TY_019310 [Phlomoides rotata]